MIIGIIGKKGSGKTTYTKYILEYWNIDKQEKDFMILKSFAEPLKEMIYKANICTKEELWREKTEYSRKMMQLIGTDLFREQVDKDFWVKKLFETINWDNDYIIDDVRFLNEAKAIQYFGGILIRLIRPDENENDTHQSETEQDNIIEDFTIRNDGDLDQLKYNSKSMVEYLYKLKKGK